MTCPLLARTLCVVALVYTGCAGTPNAPAGAEATQAQRDVCAPEARADDPLGAAMAWAADLDAAKRSSPDDVLGVLNTWDEAYVLRVWREGDLWRAVVAASPKADSGQALILTVLYKERVYVVDAVTPGSPTTLWPSS
ncbi:MAG: hypothetical protein AAGI01_11735 [Myxococcota bacterium]